MFKRVFLIVLDSVGIGGAPDAEDFGDKGAHTLKSVMTAKPMLPNLSRLGLFNLQGTELDEFSVSDPVGIYGILQEKSRGKDTTVGHWEISGLISEKPFPTYPDGFPEEIIDEFCKQNGVSVLCNKPYSGTEVIRDFGREHIKTGSPIVYTSADSVFQIAAHEDVIPLPRLYEMCESARRILTGDHAVGRVIARPFLGQYPDFYRTGGRHDYSLEPFAPTMLDLLKDAEKDVISVGKIKDIFVGKGITKSVSTKNNQEGQRALLDISDADFSGLCFANLVDFDMVFGHRNDIDGYASALESFDSVLGDFLGRMKDNDLLIITADHGCDPGFPGTDHTRERVPLLIYANGIKPAHLGCIQGFSSIAATVCGNFGIENSFFGTDLTPLFI